MREVIWSEAALSFISFWLNWLDRFSWKEGFFQESNYMNNYAYEVLIFCVNRYVVRM